MKDMSGDLWQELSGLSDLFADLGRRLLSASRQLQGPGVLPSDTAFEELHALRQRFDKLRARTCALAEGYGLPYRDVDGPENLKGLAALLETIGEAEARRESRATALTRAHDLIRHVLSLRHSRLEEFGPLAACQEQARALLAVIESHQSEEPDELIRSLAERDHPFAYLLTMLEGAESVSDDLWDSLFDAVGTCFGRQLAAAVARGRIVPVEAPAGFLVAKEPAEHLELKPLGTAREPVESASQRRDPAQVAVVVAPSVAISSHEADSDSRFLALGLGSSPLEPSSHESIYRSLQEQVASTAIPEAWTTVRERVPALVLGAGLPIASGPAEPNDLKPSVGETSVQGPVVPEMSAAELVVQVAPQAAEPSLPEPQSIARFPVAPIMAFAESGEEPEDGQEECADEGLSFFPRAMASLLPLRRLARLARKRSSPFVERLEPLSLMTCNTISGFVFLDANNNGLYEPPSDSPIANNTIELRNASGQVVATTVTDASGHYIFDADSTISTNPATLTRSATVSPRLTNFNQQVSLDQFDPSLGTLNQVDVFFEGTLISQIRAENTSQTSSQQITASSNGEVAVNGPGFNIVLPLATPQSTFNATVFDGTEDFGGTSGVDFGEKVATSDKSVSIGAASASVLASYVGTGTVDATITASGRTPATGGGNAIFDAKTSASAKLTFVYHYTPTNCLAPGQYTIVQPTEPSGTLDGKDSRDGDVLPPNMPPDSIPVILVNSDLVNNDFGEILPAQLSGYVYEDVDRSRLLNAGDIGIPGIQVVLRGVDDLGMPVEQITVTDATGFYSFTGLRPGVYSTSLPTQPNGYENWFDSRGNVVPIPGSDQTDLIPGIVLVPGADSTNNNFGEVKSGSPQGECLTPLAVVDNVVRLGIHRQPTRYVVQFNEPVDPVSASNPANYQLVVVLRNGRVTMRHIPIRTAVYDPVAHAVTLTPAHRLNIHYHYQLTVSNVKDLCDRSIDGDKDGVEGGDYVTTLTKHNYPLPLPAGPGAHVLNTATWAHRFPRLAAARAIAPRRAGRGA